MNPAEYFALIELPKVEKQVNLKRASIWKRISENEFPVPIGGRRRACWPQCVITDYLYQLSRYGAWSKELADKNIEKLHLQIISANVSDVAPRDDCE